MRTIKTRKLKENFPSVADELINNPTWLNIISIDKNDDPTHSDIAVITSKETYDNLCSVCFHAPLDFANLNCVGYHYFKANIGKILRLGYATGLTKNLRPEPWLMVIPTAEFEEIYMTHKCLTGLGNTFKGADFFDTTGQQVHQYHQYYPYGANRVNDNHLITLKLVSKKKLETGKIKASDVSTKVEQYLRRHPTTNTISALKNRELENIVAELSVRNTHKIIFSRSATQTGMDAYTEILRQKTLNVIEKVLTYQNVKTHKLVGRLHGYSFVQTTPSNGFIFPIDDESNTITIHGLI